MKFELKCVSCGMSTAPTKQAITCANCGPLKGTLDVVYPLKILKTKFRDRISHYSGCNVYSAFSEIFPYDDIGNLPPLRIGQTPLFKSPNLSHLTGLAELFIKDDSRNPSASFKDRASAVAIALARESGADTIACASTGNAASSLATLAAAAGIRSIVFIPKDAPLPKLTQILIHGARAIRLNCSYDRAFDLCQETCKYFGWYNRNTAVNPFTGEGKKSAALEIACDLAYAPDAIVIPVGDGCIIGGIHKGFSDLLGLGMIDKIPRFYGIQAAGASPVVSAFLRGGEIEPVKETRTIADSIAVGCPRDGIKALRAVRETGGSMVAVSDEEILDAQRTLASSGGIFAEPAAAASFAGLRQVLERGLIRQNESVVLLLTGHGLKDTATAGKNISCDIEITNPDIDSVIKKALDIINKTR